MKSLFGSEPTPSNQTNKTNENGRYGNWANKPKEDGKFGNWANKPNEN